MISAPQLLIAFRAACAPAIFVLACFRFDGLLLAGVLFAALVSDIFDGVLARRAGTATPALRRADTIVDTIFYLAAGIALYVKIPDVYDNLWWSLLALCVIHLSRTTLELTKYGRIAAYHMWSSKVLGLLLAGALGVAFVTEQPPMLLAWAVWLAIANELEGFAASAILPAWRNDVPSLWHALLRR